MKQLCVGLIVIAAMAGCSQAGGTTAALAPRDVSYFSKFKPDIGKPYAFTGGTGAANWTSSGAGGSCHGTLTWSAVTVYFIIFPPTGKLDPNPRNQADIVGTGAAYCHGSAHPFTFTEVFDLTDGGLTNNGADMDVTGKPIEAAIHGSFAIKGPLCDAKIKLLSYRAKTKGTTVEVDASTIEPVKQTIGC
jgi:hypothetical protein